MPDISKESVRCPNCLSPVERVSLSQIPQLQACYSDFFQKIMGSQTLLLHGVLVCPSCGFADFSEAFSDKPKYERMRPSDPFELEELPGADDDGLSFPADRPGIPAGFIARNVKPFLPASGERVFVPHAYEYAALISRERGDSPFRTALYYLHAAWACRALGKAELEPWYDGKYSEWFGKEVERRKEKSVKAAVSAYLAGEGARRSGDRNSSVRWFCRVGSLVPIRADLSWFSDFAQNQSAYPSEFVEDTLKPSIQALFREAVGSVD